ncbi:MAG: carboxymuconolactone decarboxylase family protein [Rhodoferax sp.]|nr:carboxymuconolactone decarboxylase family protein [Rhodoferax sp.]MDD5332367.1 carboxymuconolactone decarboxylase family protein [Rhodoferax sp.]
MAPPPGKTRQLIAVAVAHVTQCPYCIRGHTSSFLFGRVTYRSHHGVVDSPGFQNQ